MSPSYISYNKFSILGDSDSDDNLSSASKTYASAVSTKACPKTKARAKPKIMSVENLTSGYRPVRKNEYSQRTGISQEHKEILRGTNEKDTLSSNLIADDIQNASPIPNSGEPNIIKDAIGFLKQCLKIFNNETSQH